MWVLFFLYLFKPVCIIYLIITIFPNREGFLSRTESSGLSQQDCVNDHTYSSSNTITASTNESHTDRDEEIKVTRDGHNNSAQENRDTDSQTLLLCDIQETQLQSDESPQNNEGNEQQSVGAELTISNAGTVTEETVQLNTDERSQCQRQHVGESTGNTTQVAVGFSCNQLNPMNQGSGTDSSSACRNDTGTSVAEDLSLLRHATEDNTTHVQNSENEDWLLDTVAFNDRRNTFNDDMGNDGHVEDVLGQSLDHSGNDLVESVLSAGHHTWDASEGEDSVEDWIQRSSRQDSGAFASSGTVFGLEENVRTTELNDLIGRYLVNLIFDYSTT